MIMEDIIISPTMTIKQSIKKLDETAKKILLVAEENILVGVITDGDIRRWILKNGDFDNSVSEMMHKTPIVIFEKNRKNASKIMKEKHIYAIPVVTKKYELVDIIFWEETFEEDYLVKQNINIPVVVMAGGKGTRLYPYTKILPKPLIPIGEQTILERIMNKFGQVGCIDFFLTVNHKKNMIKAYVEETLSHYNVRYVEEEDFLGTAGSLNLLKGQIKETFFVTNCDILVEANYEKLLKFHKENKYKITLVTTLKNYAIPYGVIRTNSEGCVEKLEEKPEYNFQINTGLYILEPEVLDDIPQNEFYHITDLIEKYISQNEKVGVYPILENAWMDMGEIQEMQSMLKKLGIES
ncbi:MAG: nucleotidyltransferase [Epulopiscium sp. Nele67-Bin005]|nr:MAG: nucleotidyltransferase [Epulopiscium sp. Nele67-Bin005]